MYPAGIEPVTLVMTELQSNCSAYETDSYTMWKNADLYNILGGRGGEGRKLPFLKDGNVFFANTSPLAIDNKKFNFDVFSWNRTRDLSDGRAAV